MGDSTDRGSEQVLPSAFPSNLDSGPKAAYLLELPFEVALTRTGSSKNREDSKEKTFQSSFVSRINCVPKYVQLQKSAEEPSPHPKVRLDLKNINPIATLR